MAASKPALKTSTYITCTDLVLPSDPTLTAAADFGATKPAGATVELNPDHPVTLAHLSVGAIKPQAAPTPAA